MLWLVPVLVVVHLCHEAGHLVVADLLGVRARDDGGGQLKLAAVPIAVFYRFDSAAFIASARWKRALIALAGPATSWLLSFAVLLGVYYGTEQSTAAIIETVSPGSVAERAGILPGDRIVQFGEKKLERFEELRDAVLAHQGGPVAITLERQGARQTVQTGLEAGALLGIRPRMTQLRGFEAIAAAAVGTVLMPLDQFKTVAKLLWGRQRFQTVGGPIVMYETAPQDLPRWFFVGVSAHLAVVSLPFFLLPLLPIPRFDGARLLAALRAR